MTSKEIINAHIEHFEKCRKAYIKASDIETANEYAKDIETFKTILKDLERKEELEEENQELKFQLECKSKGNEIIIKQMDLFMKQRDKCMEENDKLKKVIEILKDKVSFEIILNLCDDEEKEALKEVLGE